MTDIKISLSQLCKHINFLFNMNTKPEMFRLAKYNKSDDNVVETFWSLLKNMIGLSVTDNIVQNIKRYFLLELRYESVQFYNLPANMSYGSRELLIALAYILSNNYLDKLVKQTVANSPLNPNYQFKTNTTQYKTENYSFSLKQLKTEEDYQRAIEWIEGRIECNRRSAIEYLNCLEKMSTKLNKTTSHIVPNTEHKLCLPEILALNNVEYAKDFIEKTDTVWKIVHNHERWLKDQSVFWQWMDSVLLERQKSGRMINSDELDTFFTTLNTQPIP